MTTYVNQQHASLQLSTKWESNPGSVLHHRNLALSTMPEFFPATCAIPVNSAQVITVPLTFVAFCLFSYIAGMAEQMIDDDDNKYTCLHWGFLPSPTLICIKHCILRAYHHLSRILMCKNPAVTLFHHKYCTIHATLGACTGFISNECMTCTLETRQHKKSNSHVIVPTDPPNSCS